MIREKGNRFYVQFKKSGKMRYYACAGCATKKQAEKFEREVRQVMDNFSRQPTDDALKTARMNIRAAADCKGEKKDSSVIALEVLPLEIVDELYQERKDDLKTRREVITGQKEIALSEVYDLYSSVPSKRIPSDKYARKTQSNWRDFCAYLSEKSPEITTLAAITKSHAEEYISYLRKKGAFNKGVEYTQGERAIRYTVKTEKLSNATINAHHKCLRTIFKRLSEKAGLTANPFNFDTLDNNSAEREVFTAEEIAKIFENVTMPYTKPIFTVGLFTGLTLGDICLLKWEEIDGEWITNKLRRKTGARLEIPILAPLRALLDEQRSVSIGGEYVFPELAQMYLENPSGVNYRVKEFLDRLEIKSAAAVEGRTRAISTKGAHALRHTFAYIAGMHNIPLAVVQQVLGHLTPEMTRHYESHARREEKELYFKRLAGAFGGQIVGASALALPSSGDTPRERARRLLDTLPDSAIEEILSKYEEAAK